MSRARRREEAKRADTDRYKHTEDQRSTNSRAAARLATNAATGSGVLIAAVALFMRSVKKTRLAMTTRRSERDR